MRKLAFALAVMISPAFAEEGWKHFENARFGFSMDVPAGFIESDPPANSDGATFTSPDGTAELRVWGAYLVDTTLKKDATQRRRWESDAGWRISYAPIKNSWFVYSGTKDERIVYTKGVSACGGDVALYFRLEYPKPEKTHYDALVTRMAESLKSGVGNQCP